MMNPKPDKVTSKDIASHIEAMESAAYQRGWEDAIKAIKLAADNVKHKQSTPETGHTSPPDSGDIADDLKPGTLIKSIYDHVKANQGKARMEIIRGMHEQGKSFNDESAKTSIKRLVARKLVEDRKGLLY